jgi:UDP-N-acetylglucosamine diphosphorylase / glucose-1-phosphate thymidylyltransferase / UDP-N-acetylgalactosamine diphosphorylase / glucosamine-1-phosphate N-acetyltransferase / galactosamine-1-phosphate N-acetyltransferase
MDGFPETFALERIPAPWRALFADDPPWSVLARLDAFFAAWGARLSDVREGDVHATAVVEGAVRIEAGARIGPHAYVVGPAWLMAGAEVGHGATVRGGVLLGPDAKVGHATEVKRSIFLAGAKAPHFNYVGDSVLGHDANLGAGVKLANLKTAGDGVAMAGHPTGLRKLGSFVGDGASIGCNAVLAPGTVVGAHSVVYAGASVRGAVPARSVVKLRSVQETVPLHDRAP